MNNSAEFYKNSMTKQDYVDVVKVLDYTPEAFLYANRKAYDKWKVIAMPVSHAFLGGVTSQDNYSPADYPISGGLKGIMSGCLVLEEINQHNHLLNRGSDYLRVKIDGSGSATYGIMGNCKNPDKMFNTFPNDQGFEQELQLPSNVHSRLLSAPMLNGWSDSLDYNLCSCSTSDADIWVMHVFTEIDGKIFSQPYPTPKSVFCKDSANNSCYSIHSQHPGSFLWKNFSNNNTIRTCEALSWPSGPIGQGNRAVQIAHSSTLCVDYMDPMFDLGLTNKPGPGSGSINLYVDQGVLVKLTSLPACNHLNKVQRLRIPEDGFGSDKLDKRTICYDPTDSQYNPEESFCFEYIRPERAAIRIMPTCFAMGNAGGPQKIQKIRYFDLIEKHFDRWDKVQGHPFKIFDEVFTSSDAGMKIRVIAHGRKYLDDHLASLYQPNTTILKDASVVMKPYFLTGGNIDDRAGGAKGCSCTNQGQNEAHYPIRPYNQFVYCPNNFTGEKTCS